jgi:transcriptional regulator with XRE-family HTH domain
LKLGENIRFGRKLHGLSQSELAKSLTVNANSVSNWERDASEPTLETLVKISKIFKVSVDDLLTKDLEREGFELGNAVQIETASLNRHNILVENGQFKNYCELNDTSDLIKVVIPGISGKARTFEIVNDSMVPVLNFGDFASCLPVLEIRDLDAGRVFVVVTKNSEMLIGYAQSFKEGVRVMPHNMVGHTWQMIPYQQVFEIWQVKIRLTKYFILPYLVGEIGGFQVNEEIKLSK